MTLQMVRVRYKDKDGKIHNEIRLAPKKEEPQTPRNRQERRAHAAQLRKIIKKSKKETVK